MTRLIDEIADYLAANIDGLTTGLNVRTDTIDPDYHGVQTVVFYGLPGENKYIDQVKVLQVVIDVFGEETESSSMAREIYNLFRDTPEFRMETFRVMRAGRQGDVIRKGLFLPGMINYGVNLNVIYYKMMNRILATHVGLGIETADGKLIEI